MTIAIAELEPWHVEAIDVQDAQAPEEWALGYQRSKVIELRHLGPAFAVVEDGRVLGIGGLAEEHSHKATAWALFAEGKGPAMVAITRAIMRVIAVCDYDRIDMIVRSGFDRACHFAELLGFTKEAELRRFGEDGSDFLIFVRFKGEQ